MDVHRATPHITIDACEIIDRELCHKPSHREFAHEDRDGHPHEHEHNHEQGHGFGAHSATKHALILEPIRDCEAAIVWGMGVGTYRAVEQAHIRPIVTEVESIEEAVHAYINGTLSDHPEYLH